MDDLYLNPRKFVPHWFSTRGYVIKANGIIDGTGIPASFGALWLDYEEEFLVAALKAFKDVKFDSATGRKVRPTKITEKNMEKAYEEFIQIRQSELRAELEKQFIFSPTSDGQLQTWLQAVTGTSTNFQVATMKHFLWQIKRKIKQKKVLYHLCPIFWGAQSGGKTTAVYTLLAPLLDFTIEFSPAEAVDPRNAKTLQDNFVCVFDEMSGMQRLETEGFKRIITAEYSTYRPMRTNNFCKVRQNTTFIGISNKSLPDNIHDTTGLRRFVEFTCLDKLDWLVINSVNINEIWSNIDDNLDNGYVIPVLEELREHQKEMVPRDELDQFIAEHSLAPTAEAPSTEMLSLQLYDHYTHWRLRNGFGSKPAVSITTFGNRLRSKKFNKKVKRIDGKEKTIYTVNSLSSLLTETISSNLTPLRRP